MKKVLVIDNNKDFRKTIADFLRVGGYEPIIVTSGYNGLIQANKKRPDLILLDIRMPRMNGLMALKKLKTGKKTAHIPVIIVTGASLDETEEEDALKLGASLILEKPFKMGVFLETIGKYIGG